MGKKNKVLSNGAKKRRARKEKVRQQKAHTTYREKQAFIKKLLFKRFSFVPTIKTQWIWKHDIEETILDSLEQIKKKKEILFRKF